MSMSFDKRLAEILEDNQSGAWAITMRVSSLFRQLISMRDIDRSEIINRLRPACRKLEKAHGGMTNLRGMVDSLLLILDTAPPREELIKRLNRIFDEWGELFVERTTLQIASQLYPRLEDVETIFTHSHSSTIFNVFRHISAKNKLLKFLQTVSWPVKEGVNMARMLASLGYRVELINDSGMATHLREADLVLLGADSIGSGYFVNKQGSLAICTLAQRLGKQIYLMADTSKLDLKKEPQEPKLQSPVELMEEEVDRISVRNFYFETVPLELVTGVLLQTGAYSPEGISQMIADRQSRAGKEQGGEEAEEPREQEDE